jgi:hypothetical protein
VIEQKNKTKDDALLLKARKALLKTGCRSLRGISPNDGDHCRRVFSPPYNVLKFVYFEY